MARQELIAALTAEGVDARGEIRESCARLDDGSYGPVVKSWFAVVTLRDRRTGNVVRRDIAESDSVDVAAVVKAMRAEMAKRAKETRAAARSWRS